MNFEYYYNSGYNKKRESLCEDVRAYLHGFECAYDDIENYMMNLDCFDDSINEDSFPTLAKIFREVRENTINNLRDWLRKTWFELIVSFIDESTDDDGSKKLSQNWILPEPLSDTPISESTLDN